MSIIISFILILIYKRNYLLIFIIIFIINWNLKLSINLRIDSYILDNLTILILFIIYWLFIIVFQSLNNNNKDIYLLILFSIIISVYLFISESVVMFYVFFELNLLPLLFLLLKWGYNKDRIIARIYIYLYSILSSFTLFIVISVFELTNFIILSIIDYSIRKIFIIFIIIPFLVKFPLFSVHLWLPKAHVERPIQGSIILAGVIIKLGLYAIWQFIFCFLKVKINILICLSLIGGIYSSFICLGQTDLKRFIAYSSVAHIGISYSGLMRGSFIGFYSSINLSLSHAFISRGIFLISGFIYNRFNRRSLFLTKSILILSPLIVNFILIIFFCNISVPFRISIIGEILALKRILTVSFLFFILTLLTSFIITIYNIIIFNKIISLKFISNFNFYRIRIKEYLLAMLIIIPLIILLFIIDFIIF